jgi:hypothetical protein
MDQPQFPSLMVRDCIFMFSIYVVHGSALTSKTIMCLEGKWNWRPSGDHVCWVLNSKLSKERHNWKPFGGNWGVWIGLRRLDLDIFYGYIIDQPEARVGSECTLSAISPNASKKPLYCTAVLVFRGIESLAWVEVVVVRYIWYQGEQVRK